MVTILWTKLFLNSHWFEVKENTMIQDNKISIIMDNNGKRSYRKRTRNLNIRYFKITNQIEKNILKVKHCSTGDMDADFMTKPIQGDTFSKSRNKIYEHWLQQLNVNLPHEGWIKPVLGNKQKNDKIGISQQIEQHECVGESRI